MVLTDPYNAAKALTWRSGSTSGRTFAHLVPLVVGIAVIVPALTARSDRRDLLTAVVGAPYFFR